MAHSTLSNMLIHLASTEMAKGCIFLATGNGNLKRGDIVSCGVNTYYGLFHVCAAIIALSSKGAFLEKAVVNWEDRYKIKGQYLPISHNKLISLMKEIDPRLTASLEELRKIREYICYGPYLCSDNTPRWKPVIYTCEILNVKPKLEAFYSKGFPFRDVSEMVAKNLKDDLHRSAFSVWIEQTLEIFKGSIGIADNVYRECHESWSTIRLALFPHTKRKTG